jgi:hypothetical protein
MDTNGDIAGDGDIGGIRYCIFNIKTIPFLLLPWRYHS